LALVLGFGLPLIALSPVQAQTDAFGPVAFTVHKASCPIDYAATSSGGIYEACHENKVEGVTFTIAGLELGPIDFVTDADGVGVAMILDGMSTTSDVSLTEDPLSLSTLGGWVYCKDQIGGAVLFDGPTPVDGVVALGSVNTSQVIICDWYNYTPAADGETDAAEGTVDEIIANG
jgi:hypothetical protein